MAFKPSPEKTQSVAGCCVHEAKPHSRMTARLLGTGTQELLPVQSSDPSPIQARCFSVPLTPRLVWLAESTSVSLADPVKSDLPGVDQVKDVGLAGDPGLSG